MPNPKVSSDRFEEVYGLSLEIPRKLVIGIARKLQSLNGDTGFKVSWFSYSCSRSALHRFMLLLPPLLYIWSPIDNTDVV